MKIQSAILLVTVSHELSAVTTVVDLLELEIGDSLRSEVHLDGWLVGLVVEVPNVDSVVLCNKDNAWAGRAEGATGVLRSTSVCRAENRLLTLEQADVPDSKVEVVNC